MQPIMLLAGYKPRQCHPDKHWSEQLEPGTRHGRFYCITVGPFVIFIHNVQLYGRAK